MKTGKDLKQNNIVIVIPARLGSSRLPNKPLLDIAGKPMIVRVLERAKESAIADILVAAAESEIVKAVENFGGRAVLTDPNHPSGTDRIYAALTKTDAAKKYEIVINLQGDLPTIEPELIKEIVEILKNPEADIATLVAEIKDEAEKDNPNVVKAILAENGRALYFTRGKAPYGDGPLYHHIGIYGYKRAVLEKFVSLPPSTLEKREKLEQLRALENGMKIFARVVDTIPLGVDTEEDLAKARKLLQARGKNG